MKVRDLIDRLSDYSEDAEVRLLHQPHYPLEYSLRGVVGESEIRAHEGEDLGDDPEVVFLLEGRQLGYGRKIAWEVSE
jgi:hypothetical protein